MKNMENMENITKYINILLGCNRICFHMKIAINIMKIVIMKIVIMKIAIMKIGFNNG